MNGYKTFIGSGIVLAAQLFGLTVENADEVATAILTVAGAVMAIYGRLKASKKIGGGELK